jgi:anti-anti-sigma regulatory factor
MLRITEETTTENITLFHLEGRLIGEWVEVLRSICTERDTASYALDLAGVQYVNQEGLELLLACERHGATLCNASLFLKEMMRQAAAVAATPACQIKPSA